MKRSETDVSKERGSVVIVVKFGGTSLAGTERMRAAARIVAAHRRGQSVVCVVSAMAGVTDTLLRTTTEQTTTGATRRELLTELRTRHERVVTELMTTTTTTTATGTVSALPSTFAAAWAALEADLARLERGAFSSEAARAHALAAFSGWGERLSVLLFSAALAAEDLAVHGYQGEPVVMVPRARAADADEQEDTPLHGPDVPWERLAPSVAATRALLRPQLADVLVGDAVAVLPGYLARTDDGFLTTLGRNGSDHSAALVAAALAADALYIYSDVAGVHRADPRAVPDAAVLPALTYADAAEIAGLGARVLHPATVRPLAAAGIPLRLRSAFAPEAPGTEITAPACLPALRGAPAWVVVGRPLTPERPLFGAPSDWEPGLVEVTGLFLRHAALDAREDDHLRQPIPPTAANTACGQPGDGPISGAMALLAGQPRPVGLALSARRISVAVPASDAIAMQCRLYAALTHADERAGRQESTLEQATEAHVEPDAERRRTS
jgi:aspartate kinase